MKTFKSIGSLIGVLILAAGCTKRFDSINSNPNSPQQVNNPQLLIPSIIKNSVRNYSYTSEFTAAVCGDYYTDQYTSEFKDAWTASQTEGGFLWNFYEQLRDAENLRILSHDKNYSNNEAVALILRSWLFQVITDNFGDIPYSQAIQGKASGVFSPAYDTQENIYYALLDSLERANTLLTTGNDPINSDILLGGSAKRWRMFANGLRLRLLMRMSGRTGLKIDVGTEMNTIASDPDTYPLFASNEDQAALNFLDEQGNEFPAFHNGPINDYHLSTTMETNLKNLDDPRIAYYAMPTPASAGTGTPEYAGVPNGIGTVESSYNGGPNYQSQVGPILQPDGAYPGKASPTAAQGLLLTYSEVQFILAEAKERGLISVGDAGTYYMNGIQDQFDYCESRLDVLNKPLPATDHTFARSSDITPPPSYFTGAGVAYTGTTDEKLYKIRLQKWFALFYNGFEGWSEWRRTGVPKEIKAGPNSAIPTWPRRTRYPLSEQTENTNNYNDALKIQGPDDLTTDIWWSKP
ncbi:MAG TPA: SusD/RagB family nutrient-binding outer membrane lipoprotein [Puia sp.]|nr:SusD/RagB family nutrient-binding outer membrane lipoprotein [Puia sp.]